MTWLLYGVWLSFAYAAGRFIEVTWQAWAVAVIVGLGPAGQLALVFLRTPRAEPRWDIVLALYVLLAGAIGVGVALFLCLLGRSRRAGA